MQYWVSSLKEDNNSRLLAIHIRNQYDDRIRISRGLQGWGTYLSSLSLPKGLNMNIGLVCDRGCKLQEINNIFITQNILDLHLVGSGSYVFPLYINERVRNE